MSEGLNVPDHMYGRIAELITMEQNLVSLRQQREFALCRPFYMLRPRVVKDGDGWLAILGDLSTGVVGCGATPDEAALNFDAAWFGKQ